MSSLSDIILDEYRLLSTEQVKRIVAEYKNQHPGLCAKWKAIELDLLNQEEDDPLWEISLSVYQFLRANCVVKSNMAETSTFSRMRRVIGEREHLRPLH